MANGRYAKRGASSPSQRPEGPGYNPRRNPAPRRRDNNPWDRPVKPAPAPVPRVPPGTPVDPRNPGTLPGKVAPSRKVTKRILKLLIPRILDPDLLDTLPRILDPDNLSGARKPMPRTFNYPWATMPIRLACVAFPYNSPTYQGDWQRLSRSGHVNAGNCGLGLQADPYLDIDSPIAAGTYPASGNFTYIFGREHNTLSRWRYEEVYHGSHPTPYTVPTTRPIMRPLDYVPVATPQDPINPNIMRDLPSPASAPAPVPAGSPFPISPSWHGWPGLVPAVIEQITQDIIDDIAQMPDEGTVVQPDAWVRGLTNPRGQRRRPDERTNERKVKTTSLLVRLFKAIDFVSERAETVDALYEAIPKELRRQWEKENMGGHWAKYLSIEDAKRGLTEPTWHWVFERGSRAAIGRTRHSLLDSAGQYGIDGADWKFRAINEMFNKVNPCKAVKGIIKNEVQDRFIGNFMKRLPVNIGHAVDDGMILVNKVQDAVTDRVLTHVGVSC